MVMGVGSGGGGNNNVMTVAKGVGNFIDEQKFTTEEKAVYNGTMIAAMGTFIESTVGENTMRSQTRRDLALLIIRWALLMISSSTIRLDT